MIPDIVVAAGFVMVLTALIMSLLLFTTTIFMEGRFPRIAPPAWITGLGISGILIACIGLLGEMVRS